MTNSERLNDLSKTFSADREFCDRLFESPEAPIAAELVVFHSWIRHYMPDFQEFLDAVAEQHFPLQFRHEGQAWTVFLLGGVVKDIGMVLYLVLRGAISEAGSVLRRALEHVGVLTHLWKNPSTAAAVLDPGSREFRSAFIFEEDADQRARDKENGVRKRFSSFISSAKFASELYEILSKRDIHGGSLINVALAQIEPTDYSCGFLNRPDPTTDPDRLRVLRYGVELICLEIAQMVGAHGGDRDERPSKVNEGGACLLSLVGGVKGGSQEMQGQVAQFLSDIRGTEWSFEDDASN